MNIVVVLCLFGGGAFLVTFVASLIQGLKRAKEERAEDNNKEGEA